MAKFPYSSDMEKTDLAAKISTSSNVVAMSGVVMEDFTRREYGTFYEPAVEYNGQLDKDEFAVNLKKIFDLNKNQKE